MNHAQQSLQPTGAYFTTDMEIPYNAEWTQTACCGPHEPTGLEISMRFNRYRIAADQLITRQRQEIARLTATERCLRQEVEVRDRRIAQLEKRPHHQTQIRDLLVGLHLRMERIEAQTLPPQMPPDHRPTDPHCFPEELESLPWSNV